MREEDEEEEEGEEEEGGGGGSGGEEEEVVVGARGRRRGLKDVRGEEVEKELDEVTVPHSRGVHDAPYMTPL